jgi:multimeric flavodoxin WrbA
MNITILNGNPDQRSPEFDRYLADLTSVLQTQGHAVTIFTLRDMDIRSCNGCFGCWLKTPGECFSPDDGPIIRRAVIRSDFTLWASPLRLGFPSARLKMIMDKSIPLIHPYFVVENNEAHHRPRYDHYPRLGLLLSAEADTTPDDVAIVGDVFSRTALNLKSHLEFALLTDQPVETVAHAITTNRPGKVPLKNHLPPTAGATIAPPQHLTIFNGSPRGRKANTAILFEKFLDGFLAVPGHTAKVHHLNRQHDLPLFTKSFAEAECVLLGFPLYTDSMPGLVKVFIETLEPYRDRAGNPPIGFLVQSGFPESTHSRHIERYLERLAARLGSPYLGTIVKGGVEGIQIMPDSMTRKLYTGLHQIGRTFAQTGRFDPDLLRTLAKPEWYPMYLAPFFKLFVKTPLATFYWDGQLKRNGVYEQRFARPYNEPGA